MKNQMRPDIVDIEYDLWRDLCGRLEETGLVTKADLQGSVTENKTDGQKLIHAIKRWAENRSNEIARRTVNHLCRSQDYVLTAVREWGQAYALLAVEPPNAREEI